MGQIYTDYIGKKDDNIFVNIEIKNTEDGGVRYLIARVWLTPSGNLITDFHDTRYEHDVDIQKAIFNASVFLNRLNEKIIFYVNKQKRIVREDCIKNYLNKYTEFGDHDKLRVLNEVKYRMDHLSLLSTDIHLPFEEIITQCCLNYINDHSLDEIEREIDDKKVMAYYSVCMQQKGKR